MKFNKALLVFLTGFFGLISIGKPQNDGSFVPFDYCANTNPANNHVQYAIRHVFASITEYNTNNTCSSTNRYKAIAYRFPPFQEVVTESPSTEEERIKLYRLAYIFQYSCDRYGGGETASGDTYYSHELARMINEYHDGAALSNICGLGGIAEQITDSHSATSFGVQVILTNGSGCHTEYLVSGSLEGSYSDSCLDVNYGQDHGKQCECSGMPSWYVTEPYLNLWVKDQPVAYRTSLGENIAFEISYKQHDTRPADGNIPTACWSHNWFSYIHFTVPVFLSGTDTSASGFSLDGNSGPIHVRSNWRFTNGVAQWKAILYGTDNGENYFDSANSIDSRYGLRLMPLDGVNSTNGFRLVHADGSQDIYDRLTSPQYTLGIVRRQGRVFDAKFDLPGVAAFGGKYYITNASGTYDSPVVDSTPNYGQPCGYHAYDAVLTRRIDPYGNTITLDYGTDGLRLKQIIDYDNKVTTLSYSDSGCLTNVSMPHGKSASFGYNSNGRLQWIKDAVGMSNSFAYSLFGTNVYLSSMTTPYGTTSFDHYQAVPSIIFTNSPIISSSIVNSNLVRTTNSSGTTELYVGHFGGENRLCKSITVTHPDNNRQLYVYRYDSRGLVASNIAFAEIPDAIIQCGNVDDGSNTNENMLPHLVSSRNTWHWNRRQCSLLSTTNISSLTASDFALGTLSHWLQSEWVADEYNNMPETLVSDQVSIARAASPDGTWPGALTWVSYGGKPTPWSAGQYSDVTVARLLPGNGEWWRRNSYDTEFGLPTATSESCTLENGSVGSRSVGYVYEYVNVTSNDVQYLYRRPSQIPVSWQNTLSYDYHDDNHYVTITDNEYNTTTVHFNDRHQVAGVQHPNGLTITNVYGVDGFLESSREVETGANTIFTFENGLPRTVTSPLGLALRYSWDKLDRLTGVGFPDNTHITNVYTRLDLTASKDRMNNWTRAGYDSMRQLSSITNARNFATHFYYCNCGSLEDISDPLDNHTHYDRDNAGNITNVTFNGSLWTKYKLNILGQVTNVSNSAGQSLSYVYNNQGNVVCVSNASGMLMSAQYDIDDRMTSASNAYGESLIQQFDMIGRLKFRQNAPLAGTYLGENFYYSSKGLTVYTDASGHSTLVGYDPAGRISSITNANLDVTQYEYNAVGNLTCLTDANTNSTWWAYDKEGRLTAETNANRVLVRTNGYDANGRQVASWTPVKGVSRFIYDANGNVVTNLYPAMAARSFSYDSLDRLTSFFNGSDYSTLTYSNFGAFQSALATESTPWMNSTVSRGYSQGRLSSMQVGATTLNIGYDGLGRPATFSSSAAGTITYSNAGAGGRINAIIMPGGTRSFGYENGLLKSVVLRNAAQTTLDSQTYEHDLDNLITNITRLNDISAAYEYDSLGQLKTLNAFESNGTPRLNERFSYNYDPSGNLLQRTNNTLTQSFVPNALNQLSSIGRDGLLTVVGSYEGSNVSKLSVNGRPTQLYSDKTYATVEGMQLHGSKNTFIPQATNSSGVLVSSTRIDANLPNPAVYQYDLNGNMTNDGRRSFEYDDENQLVRITEATLWKSEFVYDALGRRRATRDYTWQTNDWSKTNEVRYVYDGRLVVQELTANNALKVNYTRGLDLSGSIQGAGGIGGLLARTDASGTAYYHNDASGNVTAMVDGGGNVVARYLYDPFGNTLGQWGSMAGANTQRFSSKEWHAGSGLYYYGFRFYDPGLQRWINQDPLGIAGGINLHGFVGNDPMNGVDAWGLEECSALNQTRKMESQMEIDDEVKVPMFQTHRNTANEAVQYAQNGKEFLDAVPIINDLTITLAGKRVSGASVGKGERALTVAASTVSWWGRYLKYLNPKNLPYVNRLFQSAKTDAKLMELTETAGAKCVAAESGAQRIALGKSKGLDEFAASQGARTLMKDPNWLSTVVSELRAGTKFSVDLSGIGGEVGPAIQRAASSRGSPFDMELLEIRNFIKEGGAPQQIEFFLNGAKTANPF